MTVLNAMMEKTIVKSQLNRVNFIMQCLLGLTLKLVQ